LLWRCRAGHLGPFHDRDIEPALSEEMSGRLGLSPHARSREMPYLVASSYAKRWREHGDREAAYHLVTSHLRLVARTGAK